MPQKIEIGVFTLEELKKLHPEAFERVHNKWKKLVCSDSPPWSDEVMNSLRAVVNACGGTLKDWSIGVDGGTCSVRVDDEYEYVNASGEHSARKGARWMRENVLAKNGYINPRGRAYFPGNCAFTGCCFDDDCLEHVYNRLKKGDTLTEALESLATVASKHLEDAVEQQCDEESLLANWEDRKYTSDGKEIRL